MHQITTDDRIESYCFGFQSQTDLEFSPLAPKMESVATITIGTTEKRYVVQNR